MELQAQSLSPHLLSSLHVWEVVRIGQGEDNLGNCPVLWAFQTPIKLLPFVSERDQGAHSQMRKQGQKQSMQDR